MERSETKQQVRQIIANALGTDAEHVPDMANLPAQLFLDSLLVLEIVVAIEQEFQIIIEDDDNILEIMDSLDSLALYIETAAQKVVAQVETP